MQKTWNLKKYDESLVEKIKSKYNVSEIMAKLLISRNIEFEEIDGFLNGNIEDFKDPYGIKDMEKIVERIDKAISNKEKICIYGDYDVDGITSITIMYKFLTKLGADVMYYLPDRLIEGYGINNNALDEIKKKGVSLVITVDCGITAVEEVEHSKQIGLDICITDHHECTPVLPDALAIVNPKRKDDEYGFKFLAGVGVAFKVINALAIKYQLPKEEYLQYLDIVSIGTISDIVPLVGENRIISKCGLKMMDKTQNAGLKALIKLINAKEMDSMMVSFGMAPRINACGRMGHEREALQLFLTDDVEEAKNITQRLNGYNLERQDIEKRIFNEAQEMLSAEGNKLPCIVLAKENWHHGVIGIVSSKMTEMYSKPSILLSIEDDLEKGSGRSVPGFDLHEALENCKENIKQFGGHSMAVGITLEKEKFEAFKEAFEDYAEKMDVASIVPVINIDEKLSLDDISIQNIKELELLEPFGEANKTPIFQISNLKINSIRAISEGKHLKMTLKDEKRLIDVIGFNMGALAEEYPIGTKVDIVGNLEINSYKGNENVQINLKDMRHGV